MFVRSPVLYTFSLGDDLCVDVMNKKLIIDVFGVPHLFFSCCTELLVKGAVCQSESYDYIYEGKKNFGPFACLAHCFRIVFVHHIDTQVITQRKCIQNRRSYKHISYVAA